jgi:L-alanine-DL-glutamate epimerase-like enolase superfamily enzyme
MKLTRVESFLLSYPLAEPVVIQFPGGERTMVKRDAMLIRIQADNGLVGYGPGQASERSAAIVNDTIAPFLEGRTLADPDALRILFLHGPGANPELARVYSMVEVALHDLIGRALGVPVSELLGGRVRDRIRLYASAGIAGAPEKLAAEAAAIADTGFTGYKMRLALGPEKDVETIEFVRRTSGPDFELMADAHAWWRMGGRGYSPAAVEQAARGLAEQRVFWLEEPVAPDDHGGYQRLKQNAGVPLAAGAHEPNDDGLLALVQSRAVDYVQMDMPSQGGYPAARLMLTETAREGLLFAFRTLGTALDIVAAAQVAICWPEMVAEWLEYPCYSSIVRPGMYPYPLAEDILTEPLEIDAGDLVVPRGPGLGITINESVIDRYRWIPGPWSWVKLDSPAETLYFTGDFDLQRGGRACRRDGRL